MLRFPYYQVKDLKKRKHFYSTYSGSQEIGTMYVVGEERKVETEAYGEHDHEDNNAVCGLSKT